MKKLIFILLCLPFFSIGQSKKDLKKMVENAENIIKILEDETDSLNIILVKLKSLDKISEKEINELTNEIKELEDEQANLVQNVNILNAEKIKLEDKNTNLSTEFENQRIQLLDSINNLIILKDSLLNVEVSNEVSLKDIISNSTFSKSNLVGSWSLKTLVLHKNDEYIDYDEIYSYTRSIKKSFDAKKSLIDKITFIDPNIALIVLKDGVKMSCLFQIDNERKSGYKKNVNIKFVDTDRESLEFTISEYGEAYIFNYNYNSLISFFDRDDYDGANSLRINGVKYDDYYNEFFQPDDIIGVFK